MTIMSAVFMRKCLILAYGARDHGYLQLNAKEVVPHQLSIFKILLNSLTNNPAAHADIVIIKHHRLAAGNCPLRLFKADAKFVCSNICNCASLWCLTMAYLCAEVGCVGWVVNPVHIVAV